MKVVKKKFNRKNKMCSILVTGANRGIGLGLVKQILSNQTFKVDNVFATCRNIGKAKVIILTRVDGGHHKILVYSVSKCTVYFRKYAVS